MAEIPTPDERDRMFREATTLIGRAVDDCNALGIEPGVTARLLLEGALVLMNQAEGIKGAEAIATEAAQRVADLQATLGTRR